MAIYVEFAMRLRGGNSGGSIEFALQEPEPGAVTVRYRGPSGILVWHGSTTIKHLRDHLLRFLEEQL